jgi:hypothetical protein
MRYVRLGPARTGVAARTEREDERVWGEVVGRLLYLAYFRNQYRHFECMEKWLFLDEKAT